MKSTPKIFGRIAFVFKLILGFEILFLIAIPVFWLYTLDAGKLFNNSSKFQIDTTGFFKYKLNSISRFKGKIIDESYGMNYSIYSPKLGKAIDSLMLRNKQLKFYQNGKLIYVKSVDSLNKVNPDWMYELQFKLAKDNLNATIRHTDSLIKIGHLSHAYIDSTGSPTTMGTGRMYFEIKGGINLNPNKSDNFDRETIDLFRYAKAPEIALANNMILQKVSDKFRIEFIATDDDSFDAKVIYLMIKFSSYYFILMCFGITYLLHKFFTTLAKGEVFSNRQGNTFKWVGFVFLFNFILWILYTSYQNYIIRKYLALKGATMFHSINLNELIVPVVYLVIGLICLALAQVFKYGMKIEKDNERTI